MTSRVLNWIHIFFSAVLRKTHSFICRIPIFSIALSRIEYFVVLNLKSMMIQGIYDKDASTFGFAFFTDTHWGANSKNTGIILKSINTHTAINHFIFGGDFITHSDADKIAMSRLGESFWDQCKKNTGSLYAVLGNHDDNSFEQSNTGAIFSLSEISKILSPTISNGDMVTYGNCFDYYVDINKQKIRFLFLNTSNIKYATDEQRLFIIEALISAPNDYRIIAFGHIWLEWSIDSKSYVKNVQTSKIISLFDAYNNRLRTNEYDFSTGVGYVCLIVGGHIHNDYHTFSEGGIPIVLSDSGSWEKTYNRQRPQKGTPTEQCVTVFLCCGSEHEIKVIRYGRGRNLTLKLKGL